MKPYPIFLIGLEQKHCVLIGSGHEIEQKIKGLLDCDAAATLISPTINDTIRAWVEAGRLTWLARSYQPGDLQEAFLVIAEKGDPAVNAQIYQETQAVGALINIMDDIPHCTFAAGSVVRQGALTIAISTSGRAPALAVRLRQQFEQQFGPEYALFLEWLGHLRGPMAQKYPHFAERRGRWYDLVDSDILALIRSGRSQEAQERITQITALE